MRINHLLQTLLYQSKCRTANLHGEQFKSPRGQQGFEGGTVSSPFCEPPNRRGDARDSGGLPCVLQAPAFAMRACRIANSSRFCAGGSRNCCTTYMVPTLASVRQCPHGPACRRRRTSVPPRTPPTTQRVTPRVEGSGLSCRIPPTSVPVITPSRQQANPDGGNRQRRLFLLLPLPAWASRASIRGRRLGPP